VVQSLPNEGTPEPKAPCREATAHASSAECGETIDVTARSAVQMEMDLYCREKLASATCYQ
jgi:hypothetical protein